VGGSSLAISQYLIHVTDNKAMPGAWLAFAAACALVATLLAGRQTGAVPAARPAE